MTNNELTIEELHAINGGAVFVKYDGFRAARTSIIDPNFATRAGGVESFNCDDILLGHGVGFSKNIVVERLQPAN